MNSDRPHLPIMPRIIYFFMLGNFIIGTGAFALAGILQPIAQALGVSLPVAGQVTTAYALAATVIAPLLLMATGGWPRQRAVTLALGLFSVGAVVCALSSSMSLLLIGRVLMGAGSIFTALAAGMLVTLVPLQARGKALSLSFLGVSLSYLIGLPLGTSLGFAFGWQVPLWMIAAAALLLLPALLSQMPASAETGRLSFAGAGTVARQGTVLRIWLRTLLNFVALFCVLAYIGPVMRALNPLTPSELSFSLMVFGLAGVVGTFLGGWANDRFGALACLRLQLSGFCLALILLPLTQGHHLLTLAAFVFWSTAAFSMQVPQQARLAAAAPQYAPLLFSLNSSMIYLGTALGAVVGGLALPWLGAERLAWAGLPFALVALGTLWFDFAADRRTASTLSAPQP